MEYTKEYLAKFGIKPSVQRIAVMKYLLNHKTHPNVDEIFMALHSAIPTLSKTTIYNTLSLFIETGAVSSINIDKKNIRYDADIKPHAHFRCKKCHAIIDLPVPNVCHEVFAIADIYKDLLIQDVEISLKGYCQNCQKEEVSENEE